MAYNKDTDYQKLIDEAVQNMNYSDAAKYEALRNQKIADMNTAGTNTAGYQTTNNYSNYLTGSATGVGVNTQAQQSIKDQMNENSKLWWSADDATKKQLEAANQQLAAQLGSGVTYNSAAGTWSGNADPYEMLRPSFNYDNYVSSNQKPTYENPYSAQIDELLNQILNRDKFSYNAEDDPLYQQYAAQYNREGTRAVNDTLASMASNAGGMNTWAISAAQQANDYYQSQLNDRIPELYQLAYDMYLNDIDQQVRDLGLLQQMDETQYDRYRDMMGDWEGDRDFVYGQYRDDMGDFQYETSYNDALKNDAYNRAMDFLLMGVMPDSEMLKAAGISETAAKAMVMMNQTAATTASAGGGGGGGYGGGGGTVGTPTPTPTPTESSIDWDSVLALGFGPQNEEWLEDMTARGYLNATETADGRIKFSLTGLGKVYKADMDRGYNISTGKPTTSQSVPTNVIQNVQNQIQNDLKPTPAPNAAPNATPAPNISTTTDMTGTAGIGNAAATAVEWIKNQILKKNKKD